MKTLYTPRFRFALLFMLTALQYSSAQKVEFLSANNIKAGIGIGGNLFSMFDSLNPGQSQVGLFELPKGSGIIPVATSSLWISGMDAGNNPKVAAQTYHLNGPDFSDGPITTKYDSAYVAFYKRVFKVTKQQVNYFKSIFQVSLTSAMVDSAILFWPAKGNPYVQSMYNVPITSALAPFYDYDNNGWYNPVSGGDYPLICGDEAIFFVLNDARGAHKESNAPGLGIEVRGLAYVISDSLPAVPYTKNPVNNTVFVKYEIESKGVPPLWNCRAGIFEDIDLGCHKDDRVGCDTANDLMLAYNNDRMDTTCYAGPTYQKTSIALGVKMLNTNMGSFNYLNTGAQFDSIPTQAFGYRNLLEGAWANGSQFTEGGNGFQSSGTNTPFLFPGQPDDLSSWTDYNSTLAKGQRAMLGVTEPFYLAPGNIRTFDFAFLASYDSTATNLSIVDTLQRDAVIIQQFYDQQLRNCIPVVSTDIPDAKDGSMAITVFPNPAKSTVTLKAALPLDIVELLDISGRSVLVKNNAGANCQLNVSLLSAGIYLLKVKSGNAEAVRKLIIE